MLRFFPVAGLCLAATSVFAGTETQTDLLRSLPMRFEAAPTGNYRYMARGAGYAVALGDRSYLLATGDRALRLTFDGANPKAVFTAVDKANAPTTYFRGKDRRSAQAWGRVRRTGVYPGVDVVFYGTGGNLEYDFELQPGADPSVIAIRFDGADRVSLNTQGDVVLKAGDHEVTQKLPIVYQRRSEHEVVSVPSSYRLEDDGTIRLQLADYDRSRPLIVDPAIIFTAFLPGTGGDGVVGMGRDSKGFLYLAGYTFSPDFALVGDSYDPFLLAGLREGWVAKIDPFSTGNDLIVYSSYIGTSSTDDPKAVAVDSRGLVYLAGTTDAVDYPTTTGAFAPTFGGGGRKIFLSVLDTTLGTNGLVYSTYFGGTKLDEPTALAVDAQGLVYMTGWTSSDDFPVGGAYSATRSGSYDAFISVFDITKASFDSLRYSTYFGGGGQDIGRTIAVDANRNVYIAGGTSSGDFPISIGAYKSFYSGLGDAFLTRINIDSNEVPYSTYLGGSDTDQARKIILQPDGRVGITGYTFSYNYPITQNAFQPLLAGNADIFLTVLNTDARDASALVYSTMMGGTSGDVAYDMRLDASGKYYLCGYTVSTDFPLRNPLQNVFGDGGSDGFVAIIDPAAQPGSALTYSSLITGAGTQSAYGIDVDADGLIVVTGISTGKLFGEGQSQPIIPSNTNVFVFGFKP